MSKSLSLLAVLISVGCSNEPVIALSDNERDSSSESNMTFSGKRPGDTTTRWVELGMAIDHSFFLTLDEDMAAARYVARTVVDRVNQFYTNAGFVPPVRVKLVQLTVFSDGDPLNLPDSPSDTEIRNGFAQWAAVHLNANDVRYLLMTRYATSSGMTDAFESCNDKAAGWVRPRMPLGSPMYFQTMAAVLAHEIGHNLGMLHDGQDSSNCPLSCANEYIAYHDMRRCDRTSFIMGGNAMAAEFTECSKYQLGVFLTLGRPDRHRDIYYQRPECLGNAPSGCDDEASATCSSLHDTCCDSKCEIIPRSDGLVCRPPKHQQCDRGESCNGVAGQCPQNIFERAGVACQDSTGESGVCYAGDCQSYTHACAQVYGGLFTKVPCPQEQAADPCGPLWCRRPLSTDQCVEVQDPHSPGEFLDVPDGVPCAADKQCYQGRCLDSDVIDTTPPLSDSYDWQVGDWSACSVDCDEGTQDRVVVCESDDGVIVADSACTDAKPPTEQACSGSPCPTDPPGDPDPPDQPVDPENPEQPIDPENPEQPIDPENPEQPIDPDMPVDDPDEDSPPIVISCSAAPASTQVATWLAWLCFALLIGRRRTARR